MFKLKFKRGRTQQTNPHFSEEHPGYEFIDPDCVDEFNPYMHEYYHDAPYPQGYECVICNSPVTGSHLVVITKSTEYYLHPSCLLSGFALVLNGCNLLIKLLFTREKRG